MLSWIRSRLSALQLEYYEENHCVIDGIRVVETESDSPEWIPQMRKAIALIREHDPKRLRRVRACLDWIVNQPHWHGSASGFYFEPLKVCSIDFEPWGDELLSVGRFAGVIVHEATHGYLFRKGFDYTSENSVQVERICRGEQNRFLRRLNQIDAPGVPHDLGDQLIRPFSPAPWQRLRNTPRLVRLVQLIKRTREKQRPDSCREELAAV